MRLTRVLTVLLLEPFVSDASMTLLDFLEISWSIGAAGRVATDVNEVLATLRKPNHAHVLVIDSMDAPDHDMPTLMKQLKSQHRTGIVVVLKDPAQRRQALAAGADECILLPMHKQKFLKCMQDLLSRYDTAPLRADPRSPEARRTSRPLSHDARRAAKAPPKRQGAGTTAYKEGLPHSRPLEHADAGYKLAAVPWLLDEDHSRLTMPNGRDVFLTQDEKKFLGLLFRTEHGCLGWSQLVHAKKYIGELRDTFATTAGLLHRKCLDAGCMLPLHCDWRYGYVFFKPFAIWKPSLMR